MIRFVASAALVALAFLSGAPAASAMTIEKIVSPSGIEAWLVREPATPLVALNYAFHGGTSQDSAEKAGTANLAASLLDEGAGDLDSKAFHERLESRAIDLSFRVGRDYFHGSLRSLTEHREEAFDLLRMALAQPRFDAAAVERVRGQVLAGLKRETTSPNDIASRSWWGTAFPGHPYGRETKGTLESVPRITVDDMRDYVKRVFARNELTISIVGDIDAKTAGHLIDRAFAGLPAKNDLKPVEQASPRGRGPCLFVARVSCPCRPRLRARCCGRDRRPLRAQPGRARRRSYSSSSPAST
jgi:zinc protease